VPSISSGFPFPYSHSAGAPACLCMHLSDVHHWQRSLGINNAQGTA